MCNAWQSSSSMVEVVRGSKVRASPKTSCAGKPRDDQKIFVFGFEKMRGGNHMRVEPI